MCLMTTSSEQVSVNEIPVYKVLKERRGLFGVRRYYTPFLEERVSNRVIRGDKEFVASGKDEVVKESIGGIGKILKVRGGFIHTWDKSKSISVNYFPKLGRNERYVVFSCVIPCGVCFYKDDLFIMQYASKSIRFVKKME